MKKAILAALAILALAASSALAQEQYPVRSLLSLSRVSLAAGVDYVYWQSDEQRAAYGRDKEWEAGVLGAYSLIPHLALTASTRYTLDSHQFSHRIGLRLHLWGE